MGKYHILDEILWGLKGYIEITGKLEILKNKYEKCHLWKSIMIVLTSHFSCRISEFPIIYILHETYCKFNAIAKKI